MSVPPWDLGYAPLLQEMGTGIPIAPLLLTYGGHHWRPVLTCSLGYPPTPYGQTQICENLTFPQLLLWVVIRGPQTANLSMVVEFHRGDLSVSTRNLILKLLPKLLLFSSLMKFPFADRVIIFYLYYTLPH